MDILTEYYEEDFLDFEVYLQETGQNIESSATQPHANSDYHLAKYHSYEKWRKKEDLKLFRKQRSQKICKAQKEKTKGRKSTPLKRLCKDVKEEKSFVHGETEDSMSGKVILEHLFQ